MVLWGRTDRVSIYATYISSCTFTYLCVLCYCGACLKSSALRVRWRPYTSAVQLLLTYGPFYKITTTRGPLPIKWCNLYNNRSTTVKTTKGKTRECVIESEWIIETMTNSNLLQISTSGVPVAEASLTLSYNVSFPIRFLFLDLIASSQKMHSHTEKVIFIVLVQMHFIQRKQFNETNVTLHAFQQISDQKIFLECFGGPLKTLWRATYGLRACSWTTLP